MSICEDLIGAADGRLCLALVAAEKAEAAAKVPSDIQTLEKSVEIAGSIASLALAIVGLIALVFLLYKFRRVPDQVRDAEWQKIAISAGVVNVSLEQFEEAAKNTQSMAASLTEEVLELTDFVDRLLVGGAYDHGETFAPPSCVASKLSLLKSLQIKSGRRPGDQHVGLLYANLEDLGLGGEHSLSDLAYSDALPCHPLAGNAAHHRPKRPLQILWVDDRDELVAFERSMIKRQGHLICAMSDTEKAVRRIEDQTFDLIISDAERGKDQVAWSAAYDAARRMDANANRGPGNLTPFVIFTTFEKAEEINAIIDDDTEAFATHSFAQLRWRMRWLERQKAKVAGGP